MSQIGFILTGVGMQSLLAEYLRLAAGAAPADGGTFGEITKVFGMAVNGTCLHMLNHSLVKLVLFMAAGVIFAQVGSYELNQVRGFGRRKPFLMAVFVLAAAGVGGIPFLNGYVSKTLLHESIAEYGALLAVSEESGTAHAVGDRRDDAGGRSTVSVLGRADGRIYDKALCRPLCGEKYG